MTNDDNERTTRLEEKITLRETFSRGLNRLLQGAVVAGLVGLTIVGVKSKIESSSRDQQKLHQAANYLALEHYKPVGNGGALAEMNGHIPPERRQMYDNVELTYAMRFMGQAPLRTFAEYDLKTKINLTEEERRELKDIIERYRPHHFR